MRNGEALHQGHGPRLTNITSESFYLMKDENGVFVFLSQQNLISIQRQKAEVMAATASFYDSFLDVIEFRVTVSTLTHQTHCTQTRNLSCSYLGFLFNTMQKILFDLKDNTFILNITCSCITVFPPPAVTFACVFEAPAPWTRSLFHTNMEI